LVEAKERQERTKQQQIERQIQVSQYDDEKDSTCCVNSPGINKTSCNRKKHLRRTAGEIDRTFICPYDGCLKFFGSEGS